MVVDFHVHCFPDGIAERAVAALSECGGVKPHTDGTLGGIKSSMDVSGVDHSVILSISTKPSQVKKITDWSSEIQGCGITAFASIHPEFPEWRNELDNIKRLGLKGIKFHPDYQGFFVDDAALFPIYEYAVKLGLIIIFHAGLDIGLPAPYKCTPDRLSRVVSAFPDGIIVAAHMGGYSYWDDVEKYLAGTGIYLDTSYCLGWIPERQLLRIIENHGYKKILFGTDSPWTSQGVEIKRIKDLHLRKEQEKAILGENAAGLLGLKIC